MVFLAVQTLWAGLSATYCIQEAIYLFFSYNKSSHLMLYLESILNIEHEIIIKFKKLPRRYFHPIFICKNSSVRSKMASCFNSFSSPNCLIHIYDSITFYDFFLHALLRKVLEKIGSLAISNICDPYKSFCLLFVFLFFHINLKVYS